MQLSLFIVFQSMWNGKSPFDKIFEAPQGHAVESANYNHQPTHQQRQLLLGLFGQREDDGQPP
jgi:hypothetical protein